MRTRGVMVLDSHIRMRSCCLRHWSIPMLLLIFLGHVCATELERFKRTIIGYYPVCPRGCASCSSVNGCVTCRSKFFLLLQRDGMRQTGSCVAACPNGFYGVRRREFSKCRMCSVTHCEACFSRSYCTRCTPPYLAYKGECIERCTAGMYYAEYSKECKPKVDCAVNQWSVWGTCLRHGQTCGYKYGLQMRKREIIQLPSPNGGKCPITTESRRCRLKYRWCVDLLNNSSDPSKDPPPRGHWEKSRRRKRRKDKDISRNSERRHRHAQLRDGPNKGRRKRRRRMRRRRQRPRPLMTDVTTNQINALTSEE